MATSSTRPSAKARSSKREEPAPEIQISFNEIAQRAYEKYVSRGRADGFHEQDWFDAEDELRAEYRDRQ